ncbi:TetR family transcriptional regulator C-terminal domain-containing protein [Maribacter antarcticus]|uniref:TetR family transcriptional regulator C-terminal domain-containing protein n=1 Tax=Maribacter antarcticus TaxID=505250 RepID=UPI00047E8F18|nr:TetR family transcriptional regulator C-terminal domain-containing protein [Maribacter antarcticus]
MAAKAKKITVEIIIAKYMDYVLEHEMVPKSIYKFCKVSDIKEEDFYLFYGSLDSLQKGIWKQFFVNTIQVMEKNKEYDGFSNKDKMLTFFFTFFEILTLNRSYVLFVLEQENNPMKNLEQLKGLRKHLRNFAKDLIVDGNAEKNLKITKHNPQLFSEGAWLQFMFILRFWMKDDSARFEKTDMAIEKSVNTIFDVFDNTPLENILDFGKFLYKESFA